MGIKITCDGCSKMNSNIMHASSEEGETGFIMAMVDGKPWSSKCVSPHNHAEVDDDSPCEIVIACSPKCKERIDRNEKARSHLSVVRVPEEKP